MSIDLGVLVVGDSAPSGNIKSDADQDDWIWINYVTGELRKFNPATGQFDISVPTPSHLHATLGDVNFTGNISADGYDGVNQRVTIGTKKLTFKEGICILVEDV